MPCDEARNLPAADPADVPDLVLWNPRDNAVIGNVVEDSRPGRHRRRVARGRLDDCGNCFADNEFATSAPVDLEALAPCDGEGSGDWSNGALDLGPFLAEKPAVGRLQDDAGARGAGEHARRRHRRRPGPPPTARPSRPRRHRGAGTPVVIRRPGRRASPRPSSPSSSRRGRRRAAAAAPAQAVPRATSPACHPCGCRPPSPGRRGGCRSSWSSAGTATRARTTRSSTRTTRAGRTSTTSSATRPPTPRRRPARWRAAARPATSSSTSPPTGRRPCSTTGPRWCRSRPSPTTGRGSASTPRPSSRTRTG